ncbi:MAG: tRNA (adenosine(37)-N6)-threonylcarbamoyltransferase complex dimerization subunit type 1 TsaB [Burkholderiales bacterium]
MTAAKKHVLALETSSERLSVALAAGNARFHRCIQEGTRHSEHILVMINSLLDDAGVALADLDAIAFGAGPGAFTGVRLGCGVAQGLALARDIPVVAVNALQALAEACARGAHKASPTVESRIVTAIDARLGEVYFAAWSGVPGAWRVDLETALAKPGMLSIPSGSGWIGCGSAFAAHGPAIRERLGAALDAVSSVDPPDARAVLEIALVEFAAGRASAPEFALPLYVRNKVAFTIAEREARMATR